MTEELQKQRIAHLLLAIQAVFLRPEEPFRWASGIISPIYCDNRLTLSYPKLRDELEDGLAGLIRSNYPEAEALMGTATAGIAHAALVAQRLSLPMGYVRSGAKSHGRENRIEGKLEAGQKVVVIEDLISTGGSALEAADCLRQAGADVLGVVAIVSYGMKKSRVSFSEAGLSLHSLTDFDAIIRVAVEEGYIEEKQRKGLLMFRDNPDNQDWFGEIK